MYTPSKTISSRPSAGMAPGKALAIPARAADEPASIPAPGLSSVSNGPTRVGGASLPRAIPRRWLPRDGGGASPPRSWAVRQIGGAPGAVVKTRAFGAGGVSAEEAPSVVEPLTAFVLNGGAGSGGGHLGRHRLPDQRAPPACATGFQGVPALQQAGSPASSLGSIPRFLFFGTLQPSSTEKSITRGEF